MSMVGMGGGTVVCVQEVEKGAQHTALWGGGEVGASLTVRGQLVRKSLIQ